MKRWELLGEAEAPDGTEMRLMRHDREYVIFSRGRILMSSRMHGSEGALAALACERAKTSEAPSVLVGGLGLGFTLRATLNLLPHDATVVVAELVQAVVDWNRGPLGPLAGACSSMDGGRGSKWGTWGICWPRVDRGST
jgi:spermidine synthase